MNILITAIGSMSANAVIQSLSINNKFKVFGCDIYPKSHQVELGGISKFYQVNPARKSAYITDLLRICNEENISHIIPLTDVEVDVLNANRLLFDKENIFLCIPNERIIWTVRDKYKLYQYFKILIKYWQFLHLILMI